MKVSVRYRLVSSILLVLARFCPSLVPFMRKEWVAHWVADDWQVGSDQWTSRVASKNTSASNAAIRLLSIPSPLPVALQARALRSISSNYFGMYYGTSGGTNPLAAPST